MAQYWFKKDPKSVRFGMMPVNWRGYAFFISLLIISTATATALNDDIGGRSGIFFGFVSILLFAVIYVIVVRRKTEK